MGNNSEKQYFTQNSHLLTDRPKIEENSIIFISTGQTQINIPYKIYFNKSTLKYYIQYIFPNSHFPEISYLQMRLQKVHPFLFNLLGYEYISNEFLGLYFEKDGVSLSQIIQKKQKLTEFQIWLLLENISSVLFFLEQNSISHGNISIDNIYFCENCFKIYDEELISGTNSGFYLAKKKKNYLIAPELFVFLLEPAVTHLQKRYFKADVFLLGVSIIQIATGNFIEKNFSFAEKFEKILEFGYSKSLVQVLCAMTLKNEEKRLSSKEVNVIARKNLEIWQNNNKNQGIFQEKKQISNENLNILKKSNTVSNINQDVLKNNYIIPNKKVQISEEKNISEFFQKHNINLNKNQEIIKKTNINHNKNSFSQINLKNPQFVNENNNNYNKINTFSQKNLKKSEFFHEKPTTLHNNQITSSIKRESSGRISFISEKKNRNKSCTPTKPKATEEKKRRVSFVSQENFIKNYFEEIETISKGTISKKEKNEKNEKKEIKKLTTPFKKNKENQENRSPSFLKKNNFFEEENEISTRKSVFEQNKKDFLSTKHRKIKKFALKENNENLDKKVKNVLKNSQEIIRNVSRPKSDRGGFSEKMLDEQIERVLQNSKKLTTKYLIYK